MSDYRLPVHINPDGTFSTKPTGNSRSFKKGKARYVGYSQGIEFYRLGGASLTWGQLRTAYLIAAEMEARLRRDRRASLPRVSAARIDSNLDLAGYEDKKYAWTGAREFTKIGGYYVCSDCGSNAPRSPRAIQHYDGCIPGGGFFWRLFYETD